MKKIVFFSKNLEIGGMEKALVNLLNSLVNKYEVYLFLEEKKGILLNQLDNKIIIKEYKLYSSRNVLIRKILNFAKRCFFYFKYHNKFYFSCSYATYSVICSRLALISSKNNSLYIHSNYGEIYKNDFNALSDFFSILNIYKFKKVIFVSLESKEELLKYFPDIENKSVVINNIIDGGKILTLSLKKCSIYDKNKINLLFVGRLDNTSKNFDLLLSTFYKLVCLNKNYFLTILGSGNDKKYIDNLIQGYSLDNNVRIISADVNPYKHMKYADAIILPSYYEGFPVIFLEALVLNKPVFTTINVSDGYVDTKLYFYKLYFDYTKNLDIIHNNINKMVDYKFDYKVYNEYMLNKFIDEMEMM